VLELLIIDFDFLFSDVLFSSFRLHTALCPDVWQHRWLQVSVRYDPLVTGEQGE